MICPDRAGIGGSEPIPDRTVRGYADEVLELADALGLDEFAVLGYSGGGPYALSCAAGCGPRLTAAGLMAGLGPIDDRDQARDGLAASDLQLLDLALRHPSRAALQLRVMQAGVRLSPRTAVRQFAGELSAPDRAELARQDPKAVMAFFVEALRHGPSGVITEYQLLGSPWRLNWSAVQAPVHVFQGDADAMVPMHHAQDIVSRLPPDRGQLHVLPGVGHVTIQTHIAEILDAVLPP